MKATNKIGAWREDVSIHDAREILMEQIFEHVPSTCAAPTREEMENCPRCQAIAALEIIMREVPRESH